MDDKQSGIGSHPSEQINPPSVSLGPSAAKSPSSFRKIRGEDRSPNLRAPEDLVPVVWKVGDVILNQYQVTGILGEGGMGVVYKVRQLSQNIDLAVKSPRPEIFSRVDGKKNFIREAETWVNMREHPHLVSCRFVTILGGIPRIFADYIEGGTLADWIRQRKLYEGGREKALERILDIAIQFAWGLHAAHEQGLVHQDIKPANVMLTTEGVAKVTDFGLAKAREMAGEQREQGAGKGHQDILVSSGGMTPAYCSPEQMMGRQLNHKTDMWSWGLSVLELFTGEVTWKLGVVAPEALMKYEAWDPAIPTMPDEVRTLLSTCFQQHMDARPSTMFQIATRLQIIYSHLMGSPYGREVSPVAQISVSTLIDRGYSLTELGRLEEALDVFDQALRLDPMHTETYLNKGAVLQDQGRLIEALAAYEQALHLDSALATAYFNKSIVLRKLGKLEEALTSCNQAIRYNPTLVTAYIQQGITLYQLGRFNEALAANEQALRYDPTFATAHMNKSLALGALGRLEEALIACGQAIHHDPDSATAYLNRGAILRDLGRFEEALTAYEYAIHLAPTYAAAHQARDLVLVLLKGPEEKLLANNSPLDLDAIVYINKGVGLANLGRFEGALKCFERAISLDPTNVAAYRNKGVTLERLGRLEEALHTYEQAIRLDPSDARAYYNKGVVLRALKRTKEALHMYEQAIHLQPTYAAAFYAKGNTLRDLGCLEEAVLAYEQTLRLQPTYANASFNKGNILRELGRFEEALVAYEYTLRFQPNDVGAYLNKGAVCKELGRFKEALVSYEQAVRLEPTNADALHNKVALLRLLGRTT